MILDWAAISTLGIFVLPRATTSVRPNTLFVRPSILSMRSRAAFAPSSGPTDRTCHGRRFPRSQKGCIVVTHYCHVAGHMQAQFPAMLKTSKATKSVHKRPLRARCFVQSKRLFHEHPSDHHPASDRLPVLQPADRRGHDGWRWKGVGSYEPVSALGQIRTVPAPSCMSAHVDLKPEAAIPLSAKSRL